MAHHPELVKQPQSEACGPGVAGGKAHHCSGVVILYTDFGYYGPYVGQLKSRLFSATERFSCPPPLVVDLMHDAPAFDPRRSAYLLAPCIPYLPTSSVLLAVVDPGVGTERSGLAIKLKDRWLVGPDNGLLAIAAKQFGAEELYSLAKPTVGVAPTFHGRDVFADVAAALARLTKSLPERDPLAQPGSAERPNSTSSVEANCDEPLDSISAQSMQPLGGDKLVGADWPDDTDEVIYIDAYGNLHTGRRAATIEAGYDLEIAKYRLSQAQKFADVTPGELFWYENSMGMVEIAANCHSASQLLGDNGKIGTRIYWAN